VSNQAISMPSMLAPDDPHQKPREPRKNHYNPQIHPIHHAFTPNNPSNDFWIFAFVCFRELRELNPHRLRLERLKPSPKAQEWP
jgi:hypothetical protein